MSYDQNKTAEYRKYIEEKISRRLKFLPLSPQYLDIDFDNVDKELASKNYDDYEFLENGEQENGKYLYFAQEFYKSIEGDEGPLKHQLNESYNQIDKVIKELSIEIDVECDTKNQDPLKIPERWFDVKVKHFKDSNKSKLIIKVPDFWYPY